MDTENFPEVDEQATALAQPPPIVDAPVIRWDKWQQRVLEHHGSVLLRTGRQVGKSQAISRKAFEFTTANPGVKVLVIAPALRQTGFIYDKILAWFEKENAERLEKAMAGKKMRESQIAALDEKTSLFSTVPTRTKICLRNGSIIYCYPAGRTGIFVMGMTIDVLIVDEAAFIPDVVYDNVLPMLAVSKKMRGFGWIWMASIPFWKGGFFYDSEKDLDFLAIHISSEDCPRIMKSFLDKERRRLSSVEYARIYRGEYGDEWNQFFPTELLNRAATFMQWTIEEKTTNAYYLGVDIARYGKDENAFVVAELRRDNSLKIVKAQTTMRMSTTDTIGRILALDVIFGFRRIFIDDGGVGGGVLDVLLEKKGSRVVGLNNAARAIDKEGHRRSILKEDLYSNALILLENGKVEMINDMALLRSLKSMIYEYTSDQRVKIHGKASHLAEAFVRACWGVREKGLRAYIA